MKSLRPLTLAEIVGLTRVATLIRDREDRDLGNLLLRVASGDQSALVPACDRLRETGRDDLADRLQKTIGV